MKEEPSNPNAEEKSADQCPPESSADALKNLTAEQAKPALTPEEQMAAFEKDLKENDWGHQPC